MEILKELEDSLRSDAPSYIEFLYRYNPKKKQVFAFYEGDEDSSFYHRFLRAAIDDDCELEEIVAGCKNNVIKLQKEFDWNSYNNKQIVFFIDRDLSYWLEGATHYDENIFVTDEYSVENYVVSSQGFKSWLIHFEGFARASKKELDNMVSQYEACISDFKQEMMQIMAEAVVAKRYDPSISLSEFKISRDKSIIFKVCNGHLDFKINRERKVLEKWKLTREQQSEIAQQMECFSKNISHYAVRGKWILCFMAELGEYMRLNAGIFAPSLNTTGKIKHTCSVSSSQCFSALAPYCTETIPKSLDYFLNRTYRIYLKSFK